MESRVGWGTESARCAEVCGTRGSLRSDGTVGGPEQGSRDRRRPERGTDQRTAAWQATQPAAYGRNSSRSMGMPIPQAVHRP